MVAFDPSLKGLAFDNVGFYDGQRPSLYVVNDRRRIAFV